MSERITDSIREARSNPKADFHAILSEHGVSHDVVHALLADGVLGGGADIAFLQKRLAAKSDPREKMLLDALSELDATQATNTSGPKAWSSSSRYTQPGFDDMRAIENGDQILKQGDGGALVGEAWDLLDRAGYREAKYGRDQRYGSAMADKVRQFQLDRGMTATGELDRETLLALRDAGRARDPEQARTDDARTVAREVTAPVSRRWNDWVVRDHEARSSIEQLSRYDQRDLNRITAEMDPNTVSRMLSNLSDADRAQYQPTIDRIVIAQNSRRETVGNIERTANELRGQVTSRFGNMGVTDGEARSAIDRMSRMNDRDFAAVADRLGSDALTEMVDNLNEDDRRLYAPTIARLQNARNAPRSRLGG